MTEAFLRVHVTCRCGRVYFEGQNEALWACARRHAEDLQHLADFQNILREVRDSAHPA